MINSERDSNPRSARTPLEEEQFLCNEALRTGAFDELSDKDWVAMCERVAIERRDNATDTAVAETSD